MSKSARRAGMIGVGFVVDEIPMEFDEKHWMSPDRRREAEERFRLRLARAARVLEEAKKRRRRR